MAWRGDGRGRRPGGGRGGARGPGGFGGDGRGRSPRGRGGARGERGLGGFGFGGDGGGRGPGGFDGGGGGGSRNPYGHRGGHQQAYGREGRGGGYGMGGGGRGRGRGGGEVPTRPAAPPIAAPVGPAAASTPARPHRPPPATSSSSSPAPLPDASSALRVDPAPPVPAHQQQQRAPPTRPGYGTVGEKVMVRANHFLVQVAHNDDIYHYDVSISPEPKARQTNRVLLAELVNVHAATSLDGRTPAYDGSKSLYTAGELPFKSMDFVVKLGKERREIEYKITIRYAGSANLHHLQQFLRGQQRDSPEDTIQALDVVLRESSSLKYVTVSRSFFCKDFGHSDIGQGLECWRGYYQSLRPTQMGLSLNMDISSTAFYKPISVIKFVQECVPDSNPKQPIADLDRMTLKKALRGVRVETTHGEKRSVYKITGITSVPLAELNFSPNEEGQMTVVQYFATRYSFRLQYTAWPCLQSGKDSKPIYLPMEACQIIEGQKYPKKLSSKQVTNILKATCEGPKRREKNILQMVDQNNYLTDGRAEAFGITLSKGMANVEARVLPPPMLKYHESGREETCAPSYGKWNMVNKRMVNGGSIRRWTCLNFSSWKTYDAVRLCRDLAEKCNSMGMDFNKTPVTQIQTFYPNQIEGALREVNEMATDLELLIVILPDVAGHYGKIKRLCETELGIVSQCININSKHNHQYLENVALKINVKVGGRNTVLESAIAKNLPFVSDIPTIIFGADVSHPAAGEDSSASIAAVVASMDLEVTTYKALVSAQAHRQEIIQDLFCIDKENGTPVYGGMIRELLLSFYQKTHEKPLRIIFYRDGVSEGQFSHVLLHEVNAIRKACASIEEGYQPTVTFVVVQKRHHTRLFPEGRQSRNILPGTVVDTSICHPSEFDFYLCSHEGIMGTSRPAHYHVLHDENRFSADDLQMLTNSLCYTYARCTCSVSLVPPVYYAHLAAYRARFYDKRDGIDAASDISGGAGGPPTLRRLPQVKENVKNVMFFC
ncbi:hypothetical protein QOZ80_7AG0559000 [Eleusine coracana subsp. coracana]|nr:hypothetical protein QOZ80_7AG0559000 [Eleusine coracana subsp. coracana]